MAANMAREVAMLIRDQAQSGSASWDELNGPDAVILTTEDSARQVILLPVDYDGEGRPVKGRSCRITVEMVSHP